MATSSGTCWAPSNIASQAAGVVSFSPLNLIGVASFLMGPKLWALGFVQLATFVVFIVFLVMLAMTVSVVTNTGGENGEDAENAGVKIVTQDTTITRAIVSGVMLVLSLILWAVSIVLVWMNLKNC